MQFQWTGLGVPWNMRAVPSRVLDLESLGFRMDSLCKTLSMSQKYLGHYLMLKWGRWKEAPLRSLSVLETDSVC